MSTNHTKMDCIERKIITLLSKRLGENQAVSMDWLAGKLTMSSRLLRSLINHLILEHNTPIMCSTRRKASGYYWCNSEHELKNFNTTFKKRAITSLSKAAAMNRQTVPEVASDLLLDYFDHTKQEPSHQKITGLGKMVHLFLKIMLQQPIVYQHELSSLKDALESR